MLKRTKDLKKGDVILAFGDDERMHKIERRANGGVRVEVTKFVEILPHDGTVVVEVTQPTSWVTSPRRYLRADAPLVKIARWSTILGKRWLKVDDDLYESPDGRWTIERDDMERECEGPHPVQLTRKLAQTIVECKDLWPYEAVDAAKMFLGIIPVGYGQRRPKGYKCPGNEYHTHKEWVPHRHDVENFDHMGAWADSPSEAIRPFIEEV